MCPRTGVIFGRCGNSEPAFISDVVLVGLVVLVLAITMAPTVVGIVEHLTLSSVDDGVIPDFRRTIPALVPS